MSSAERRTPRLFLVLAFLLLVVPLGIAVWWFSRPTVPPRPMQMEDYDIVCTGRVDVPGTVIALEPTMPGRIIKVLVKEGETVKADQPILELDTMSAEHRLSQTRAAVELAKVEVDAAKREVERFPKQKEAQRSMVKAAGARVEAAEKMFEQRKSQTTTPVGKAESEALEAQIRELKLIELAQQAQYEDLGKVDPQLRVRMAQTRLQAAEADQALAERGLRDCTIRAPSDGMILRLQVSVGGIIAPGGYPAAVVFAPAGKLIVRAEVEQEYLGRVKEGARVSVQDENLADGIKRTGSVLSLSKWVAQRRSVLLEPGEINDVRTMECIISIDDPSQLSIGQRMRVRIKR